MIRFSAFFCDEVRQEISGKHLMVGVYSGDLIPASVPGSFPLAAVLRIQGLTGDHHFHMRLMSPNGTVSADIEDDIEIREEADAFPLVFSRSIIEVEGPGLITMEFALDHGDPEVVASLKVHEPDAL